MANRNALPLVFAIIISLFSFMLALLLSREAPIPFLMAGGFGALAVIIIGLWALWFVTPLEKEEILPEQEGEENQDETGASHQ